MSSDEEDYMSANFVVESPAEDVRPGLLHSRSQKRSHDLHKKKVDNDAQHRELCRPTRIVEAERREEGLQNAIGSENKGFAMLQKMGYKPGCPIGKSGEGLVTPVPIQLKSDRQGLGRAAALEELKIRKDAIRAKRQKSSNNETITPEQYRARMMKKTSERLVEVDLLKSQKACYQLDSEEGHVRPAEKWFWPKTITLKKNRVEVLADDGNVVGEPSEAQSVSPCRNDSHDDDDTDDEESDDEFEASEKLEMLTKYLHSSYNYCIWCCIRFDDEKDMQNECPGPTREDH